MDRLSSGWACRKASDALPPCLAVDDIERQVDTHSKSWQVSFLAVTMDFWASTSANPWVVRFFPLQVLERHFRLLQERECQMPHLFRVQPSCFIKHKVIPINLLKKLN
jgi:hypothetical protein